MSLETDKTGEARPPRFTGAKPAIDPSIYPLPHALDRPEHLPEGFKSPLTHVGELTVVGLMGGGPRANVYEAIDKHGGRHVMKVSLPRSDPPSDRERESHISILNETAILHQVSRNPVLNEVLGNLQVQVPRYEGAGVVLYPGGGKALAVAMTMLPGVTLLEHIHILATKNGECFSLADRRELVDVSLRIAAGIVELYKAGITLRDFTSLNTMVDTKSGGERPAIALFDFEASQSAISICQQGKKIAGFQPPDHLPQLSATLTDVFDEVQLILREFTKHADDQAFANVLEEVGGMDNRPRIQDLLQAHGVAVIDMLGADLRQKLGALI